MPNNVYGWQKCTDAIRKIRVNIGETYGTTPTYYAGSNVDYIVWNGVLEELDFPSYDYTDFVFSAAADRFRYLSRLGTRDTFEDRSLFAYTLTSVANDAGSLRIKTYDSAGSLIGTSNIANPYAASTTYTDKYLCIDVGHKGLSQISSGLVTGAYPIITSSVASYTVEDSTTYASSSTITLLMTVTIKCEAKCEPYVLHALFKNGDFESVPFPKVSEINNQTVKVTYKRNPFALTGSYYTYSNFTGREITLNSTTQQRITLQTDWMTYEEIEAFKEIIDAPQVYIDYGSTIGLIPVQVETNSYKVLQKWNTGNPYFQITIRQGHTNTKQRG